jgi:hypothetical protein
MPPKCHINTRYKSVYYGQPRSNLKAEVTASGLLDAPPLITDTSCVERLERNCLPQYRLAGAWQTTGSTRNPNCPVCWLTRPFQHAHMAAEAKLPTPVHTQLACRRVSHTVGGAKEQKGVRPAYKTSCAGGDGSVVSVGVEEQLGQRMALLVVSFDLVILCPLPPAQKLQGSPTDGISCLCLQLGSVATLRAQAEQQSTHSASRPCKPSLKSE